MQELRGVAVINKLAEKFFSDISYLAERRIIPKLAIVRVGEREDDLVYEKGILKKFSAVNALTEVITLPEDIIQENLEDTIVTLNNDKNIHGILVFRPLPKYLSEDRIKNIIAEQKDVDGMGTSNIAHVFSGNKGGYPPCTPQAVIELLDYYGIETVGKNITIVGRSLVVGKPLAMLLLSKNATVTICHTKTINLADICKKAEILIACAGVSKMVNADFINPGQVVIDVGINMDNGKVCGDVNYDEVAKVVKAITPVPGGIGVITTSVLLKHTIQSAMKVAI